MACDCERDRAASSALSLSHLTADYTESWTWTTLLHCGPISKLRGPQVRLSEVTMRGKEKKKIKPEKIAKTSSE